jgi:hypothetical protein
LQGGSRQEGRGELHLRDVKEQLSGFGNLGMQSRIALKDSASVGLTTAGLFRWHAVVVVLRLSVAIGIFLVFVLG